MLMDFRCFLFTIFMTGYATADPIPLSENEMGDSSAFFYGGNTEEITANLHKKQGIDSQPLANQAININLLPDTSGIEIISPRAPLSSFKPVYHPPPEFDLSLTRAIDNR